MEAATKPGTAAATPAGPAAGAGAAALPTWARRVVAPSAGIAVLFIANRGEIARRIRRTTDRLGIRAVIPATDGPHALDLLDGPAVVAAAVAAGAQAIHPGFGFLAENADFAAAVIDAGLRWVGPPPKAIRAMGDKAAARRLATRLGVAVVPGYDGAAQSDRSLRRAAGVIGYPLLVKPAGGGGGKGMRVVREAGHLGDALGSARREAMAAFGDDRVILERLVEGGRHVEIQVLFDQRGHGIHLGERDCSTQRRHQKVLEETPSPAVSPELRSRLAEAALRLASAVGYAGAGTCEFLATDRGEAYFLEMNTRLQVEHPVTELVTGLDLVELQLRIAAGEGLPIDQAAVDAARVAGGHAVEVRLYAEDAEHGFLPATGRVERLAWPKGPGIRVDAGIDEGTEATGRFDPMLAKVIVHGHDRAEALDRLADALDATVVLGLVTNLRFLRWLVRQPAIHEGQMRVDTLDRIWPPDDWTERSAVPDLAWRTAASRLAATPVTALHTAASRPAATRPAAGREALEAAAATLREPAWGGGWRLNGPPRIRLVAVEDPADERTVSPAPVATDEALATDEARTSPQSVGMELASVVAGDGTVYVDVAGRSVGFRLAPPPDVDRSARLASAHHGGGAAELRAPMPGSIVTVHRRAGESVALGDPIVTLEAMKMEHVVAAPAPGLLAEVEVRPGDQVTRGQRLATIEPPR